LQDEPIPFIDLKAQYRGIEAAVHEVLHRVIDEASFILGPEVSAFESEFAEFLGTPYCAGVGSGTSALKLGMQALGIGPGDEVIVPANTFIACAFAVTQLGARPVLVDVGPDHLVVPSLVEAAITPRTKAIMAVHLYGQVADLDALGAICARHGVHLAEDGSQAHGARYGGRRAGSFGAVSAYSFYPAKNLGAYGDAGAVCTAAGDVVERVRALRDLGQRTKSVHSVVGENSRLDSLQAAILRVKLRRLDEWNGRRLIAAKRYDALLADTGFSPPLRGADEGHVYQYYVVRVRDRDRVREALRGRGIATNVNHPIPIHLQPAYADLGLGPGAFPMAEATARTVLSLPMFPELRDDQIERVVAALGDCAVDGSTDDGS
jgi:dTDP-4-amino-4,6-dideoxygalactose transaminase